jgi:hypothetical protein
MAKRKPRSGKIGRRRGSRRPRTDYDGFWKEALDRYFERFMAFVFPRAHAEIDWTRGYEMLDKELQPIVRQAKRGRRYVDKLVKVWLTSGQERWILIHVEVQTGKEGEFPKRMVVYNHRLSDRYDREVISLAILADDDPDWRPNQFGYSRWGFRTVTEFPIVKLLDYAARGPELEVDPNPFALVVLAHLKTLETRRSPADRYAWKLRLVKGLYDRGMGAEEIRQLFRFIDWIMELPEEREGRFWQEITTYQREKVMPFVTIAERVGREKGIEEGKALGRSEGLLEGTLKGIESCLELKFGVAGLELMPDIREIHDHVVLEKVLHAIRAADSPEDLRRVWSRKGRSKREKPAR